MRTNVFLYLFTIAALLNACKNNEVEKKTIEQQVATALVVDARLKQADSLVVVFYNDPYGEDSLRYTRYYKQVSLIETGAIEILQKQLSAQFKMQEKRNTCRGEGKIWCFTNGKVFQTLYFSTRCEDCCYLYLIKDGNFYYTRIATTFIEWLESIKTSATTPLGGSPETSSEEK